MDNVVLSAAEAAEYGEFKRTRREAEVTVALHKLIIDALQHEDRYSLKTACNCARKMCSYGVLVSPVGAAAAKRHLQGSECYVIALVGGTGETLSSVKKYETKRAISAGAREIRLAVCYSALKAGNFGYVRREIKKVKRAARRVPLVVSLEDRRLSADEIALAVRCAADGGADAVCVRGETELVLRALRVSAGKLRVDASGVENAGQLKDLQKAGAACITTAFSEQIAGEMYKMAQEAGLS